jgi:hypothetical protein
VISTGAAPTAYGLPFVTGTVDAAHLGPAVGRLRLRELTNLLEEFPRVLRVGHRRCVATCDVQTVVKSDRAVPAEMVAMANDAAHRAAAAAVVELVVLP